MADHEADSGTGSGRAYINNPQRLHCTTRALLTSHKRYQQLVEAVYEGIAETDQAGIITCMNKRMATMLGYDADELIGRSIFSVIDSEDHPTMEIMLRDCRANAGSAIQQNLRYCHRDGSVIWACVAATPICDAGELYEGSWLLSLDITASKRVEEQRRAQYMGIPIPVYTFRYLPQLNDWELIDCNTAAETATGGAVRSLFGQLGRQMYHDRPDLIADAVACTTKKTTISRETRIARASNGELRTMIVTFIWAEPDLMMISTEDITERQQAEESLKASERRLRALMENTAAVVAVVDEQGIVRYASPSYTTVLGRDPLTMIGRPAFNMIEPEDAKVVVARWVARMNGSKSLPSGPHEMRVPHADGSLIWMESIVVDARHDSAIGGFVITGRDITARKRIEEALRHQTLHDALTGLPNRTLLSDRLHQAIATSARDEHSLALLLLDLNKFKEVNDTFGHHLGDAVLCETADRLTGVLREGDTVARLGGDEFAMILAGSDHAAATAAIQRIRGALAQPAAIAGLNIRLEASIGVAVYPHHGSDPETLLRRADIAMYVAKRSGEEFAFFADEHDIYTTDRLALIDDLRVALRTGTLLLYYQPQVDLLTGALIGVEALVRWPHPQRGLIPPDMFVPLAEESGLIGALTDWVLEEAIRQVCDWRACCHPDLAVAVNISAANLRDPHLADQIATLLATYDVPPASLRLEVTEGTLMADAARAQEILARLASTGVGISVDDYGTGYSNLAYLKYLKVDELKIDRSFVGDMSTNATDAAIVASTIVLGHALGLRVVAEGAEDAATWQALREMSCDVAQGYYFARPLPASEVEKLFTP